MISLQTSWMYWRNFDNPSAGMSCDFYPGDYPFSIFTNCVTVDIDKFLIFTFLMFHCVSWTGNLENGLLWLEFLWLIVWIHFWWMGEQFLVDHTVVLIFFTEVISAEFFIQFHQYLFLILICIKDNQLAATWVFFLY